VEYVEPLCFRCDRVVPFVPWGDAVGRPMIARWCCDKNMPQYGRVWKPEDCPLFVPEGMLPTLEM
jgi:hypothetical protein